MQAAMKSNDDQSKELERDIKCFCSQVSVEVEQYDILRFWALGKEAAEIPLSLPKRIINALLQQPPPKAQEYYKRVVAAVRLKRDDKLILKAFKEVCLKK